MINTLTAVQFTRFMTSGRTSPALCGCENETGESAGNYVVKFRGSIQERGLVNELIGAKLAAHFKLPTPSPALIVIDRPLVQLIVAAEPSRAEMVTRSEGLNFGTEALIGFSTWPTDKPIPEIMQDTAVEIFAFDALLQNPDRRHNNPNLLTKGDTIMLFDHEVAFSFLWDIFPSRTPWVVNTQRYLSDHVFFKQLKSQEIDLNNFTARLVELTQNTLQEIFADVPAEWKNDSVARIAEHLLAIHNHAEEFAEQTRRFLV